MLINELGTAIRKRIEEVGSEPKLSQISGVTQQRINILKNKLHTGSVKIDGIRLGTLIRLFPNMRIDFFGTGNQKSYIGEITKILNGLSETEHKKIYEAILICYPPNDNKLIPILKNKEISNE